MAFLLDVDGPAGVAGAVAYQAAGDLARAGSLFEANLADCERVLGPDHPETLVSRDWLNTLRAVSADRPGLQRTGR